MYNDPIVDVKYPGRIFANIGMSRDFLDRYTRLVQKAQLKGKKAIDRLAPHLFPAVADERNLWAAWNLLAKRGGDAPGPNERRYSDLRRRDVWELMRVLHDAITNGTYRHGGERKKLIPKDDGKRFRTLRLENIEDRVVGRGIKQILEPFLDPRFDCRSFGFRPRRNRMHALARAEHFTRTEDRHFWVVDDLRDAFDNIPLNRLVDVLDAHGLPKRLIDLVREVLSVQSGSRGLRQGSPISQLMLNIYLDHFIDRPWRNFRPNVPMLRYADDFLLLCQSATEGEDARQFLRDRLVPAGMSLKGDLNSPRNRGCMTNLKAGESVDWLGFRISMRSDIIETRIVKKAWCRLERKLQLAHEKPGSPLVANSVVRGWIEQQGPCFPNENQKRVFRRIAKTAAEFAFDEIPAPYEMAELWELGFMEFQRIREKEHGTSDRTDGVADPTAGVQKPSHIDGQENTPF